MPNWISMLDATAPAIDDFSSQLGPVLNICSMNMVGMPLQLLETFWLWLPDNLPLRAMGPWHKTENSASRLCRGFGSE